MCGIHAVLNKRPLALASLGNYMEQGFVVNTLRGMDSSGIFQVDKQHKLYMTKQMVAGHTFAETKVAKRFFTDVGSSIITVGHVRAATHGKVTTDNAHPFSADRPDGSGIIGVHNGTITNWRSHKDSAAYDVDSEWALNLIAKEGADAFEQFNGSYCFMWWDDKHPDKLFVVRNEDRPMHMLLTKSRDAALFASEAGMIAWLAERNKIECDEMICSIEPHKMYAFDMDKTGTPITWTKSNVPKYTPKTYSGTTVHNHGARKGGWNPQTGKWDDDYTPGTGYNTNASTNTGASGGSATSASFPYSAVSFCAKFKGALAQNRADRFKHSVGGGSESGLGPGESSGTGTKSSSTANAESTKQGRLGRRARRKLRQEQERSRKTAESTAGLNEQRAEMDPHGDYTLPPAWYSTHDATTVEMNMAKSVGVMGELQMFIGVAYEPQTGELIGEIEEYVSGQGKLKHTAILRGLSATAAKAIIDQKFEWVAIIGIYDDYVAKEKVLVCSRLTDLGVDGMKRMAA